MWHELCSIDIPPSTETDLEKCFEAFFCRQPTVECTWVDLGEKNRSQEKNDALLKSL